MNGLDAGALFAELEDCFKSPNRSMNVEKKEKKRVNFFVQTSHYIISYIPPKGSMFDT